MSRPDLLKLLSARNTQSSNQKAPASASPRKLQTEPFLKGPIPIRLLEQAAQSGKAAFLLGIILWFRRGLLKKDEVDLNLSGLSAFALNRQTAGRAMKNLEGRGLALVERIKGRKLKVRILQIENPKLTPKE